MSLGNRVACLDSYLWIFKLFFLLASHSILICPFSLAYVVLLVLSSVWVLDGLLLGAGEGCFRLFFIGGLFVLGLYLSFFYWEGGLTLRLRVRG